MQDLTDSKVGFNIPNGSLSFIRLDGYFKQFGIDLSSLTPRKVELNIDLQDVIAGLESLMVPAFGSQKAHPFKESFRF